MADPEHERMLKESVKGWNEWRRSNPEAVPDLSHADLRGLALEDADLGKANLSGADLRDARLAGANFVDADLTDVNLGGADLSGASLVPANLSRVRLTAPMYACDIESTRVPEGYSNDSPIWRYMDFTKFVALLENKTLFFARCDRLGDPFEGSMPLKLRERRAFLNSLIKKRGRVLRLYGDNEQIVRDYLVNTIVSCWHVNEYESAAMWKLYLTAFEGVAIRSTAERLARSLPRYSGTDQGYNEDNTERELIIGIGPVEYVDYEEALSDEEKRQLSDRRPGRGGAASDLVWYKRKSFQHEKELRAVAQDLSFQGDPARPSRFPDGGDNVSVNLEVLVERLYVTPHAPKWFTRVVESVVQRHGFNFPVVQSSLSDDPVY